MNERRTCDPFSPYPFDDTFRTLMRPRRFDTPSIAPRVKIDVSATVYQCAVKVGIPEANHQNGMLELKLPKKTTSSSNYLAIQ